MDRKEIHRRLHAISIKMCGDDTALRSMLDKYGVDSCLKLTDEQAKQCLEEFEQIYRDTNKKIIDLSKQVDPNSRNMTKNQRAMLIRLTKYKFKWTKQGTFSYILNTIPELRDKLTPFEIKKCKLNVLFSIMSVKDADKVLKRLLQLEKKNERQK